MSMASNSSNPAQRKVVSAIPLHLDKTGYGPKGQHTRLEWRKECLDNLLSGKEQFEAWQAGWKDKVDKDLPLVSHASKLVYSDDTAEVIFNGYFDQAAPATLDFATHIFAEPLEIAHVTFSVDADFHSAMFIGYADFRSAKFTGYADFRHATFTKNAFFDSATFTGYANFRSATFTENVFFISATFTMKVFFVSATFTKNAFFDSATFTGDANFRSAEFSGDADFIRAAFSGDADFISAAFSGEADFQSATFDKDANFFKVLFKNQCRFDNKQNIKTQVWEKESKFGGAVDFENAIFDNVGHFERVRFLKETPKFRGCKIGDTRLEFSDDSYFPQNEKGEDAVKNISFLKRLAEEHGADGASAEL